MTFPRSMNHTFSADAACTKNVGLARNSKTDMATRVNARGRPFINGKALSNDLREIIVRTLTDNGADIETGKVPRGILTQVSVQFKISQSSVTNIWKKYFEDGKVDARPLGVKPRKLSDGDIELIQTIVKTNPSASYKKYPKK